MAKSRNPKSAANLGATTENGGEAGAAAAPALPKRPPQQTQQSQDNSGLRISQAEALNIANMATWATGFCLKHKIPFQLGAT